MMNKKLDYLEWLHQMREEEKNKRMNKSTESVLKNIKDDARLILKKYGLKLPRVERTKIKV